MSNFDLSINVTSSMVNGQIYFDTSFNRKLTSVESGLIGNFRVNLSRGATKMYALNCLSDHNGHGATWNQGSSGEHGTIAQAQYRNRVGKDIAAQWEAFKAAVIKANTPVVPPSQQKAVSSGSQVFFASNGG